MPNDEVIITNPPKRQQKTAPKPSKPTQPAKKPKIGAED